MAFFEVRTQNVRVTLSPFSTDTMLTIGQIALDHMIERIQNVTDNTDSPAKPLQESYAEQKKQGRRVALGGPRKYTGRPVRDWTLRGRTLKSLKVKFASQERATIGPTMDETARIISGRDKKDHMWGLSPKDNEVMYAAIVASLRQNTRVVRTTGGTMSGYQGGYQVA